MELVDGNGEPYGIPDYWPGSAELMRLLTFAYEGAPESISSGALYSTGRASLRCTPTDGGQSWSAEDALAYFPIY